MMWLKPPRRKVGVILMDAYMTRDGKLARGCSIFDNPTMMSQLRIK